MDRETEALIENYKPDQSIIQTLQSVKKVFLVGISGAGKDTIIKNLLKTGNFYLIISHTTRAPRKNHGILETEGIEYHFITYEKLKSMLENREFVEAKKYARNVYGTSVAEFEKAKRDGKIAIADIEVQGVAEYMSMAPQATKPIFLLPPDFTTWKQRFNARYEGVVGEGEFRERMQVAAREIEHVLTHHYFSIVINDDINDTVKQVELIANGQSQSDASWQRGVNVAHHLLEAIEASLSR